MKKIKILITGSNGQLGVEFQKFFEKININYIAVPHKKLDITNISNLYEVLKNKNITHILNCASYNDVDKAEKNSKLAYKTNALGVKNLSLISNKINAKLIHFSTDYVFDGSKNNPYNIFDTPNPINEYGKSKLIGEKYLKKLSKNYLLIRTSWLFGGNKNFIKKVLEWSKKEEIRVSYNEVSSPTYTLDLVKVTFFLIKQKSFGTYHITNTPTNRYEWAKFILNKIKYTGKIVKVKKEVFNLPAKRPNYSVLLNNHEVKISTWQKSTNNYLRCIL
ncbi:dTDP-4-dehydrorhamnose reductase [Tepiditoga spiralis]|uniref:dTDP-4-dehydrorhamnose reductase n=1 Tax=Tepiditoga spiralis TaxID=2108365 RepID=UPI001683101D|nr:dTDP-4-dehydrorhamnose reductase [Tepiditoga spiralis]